MRKVLLIQFIFFTILFSQSLDIKYFNNSKFYMPILSSSDETLNKSLQLYNSKPKENNNLNQNYEKNANILLKKLKYRKALSEYKNIKKDFINSLLALDFDPFQAFPEAINNKKVTAPFKLNKIEFLEKFIRLCEELKINNNNPDTSYYIANAYFNISIYGNSPIYNIKDMSNQEYKRNNLLLIKKAKYHYQQVLISTNDYVLKEIVIKFIERCKQIEKEIKNNRLILDSTKIVNNIGFIKNEKLVTTLQKKFPICDEFLNVQWVDKTKRIAFLRYEQYDILHPGVILGLVFLDTATPHYDYDIYTYKQSGFKKLFNFIRKGRIVTTKLSIQYKDKKIIFSPPWGYEATLSRHSKNVCLLFPNKNKVWISERKLNKDIYSTEELEQKLRKINQFFPKKIEMFDFQYATPLDVNFDGEEDYFFNYNMWVYSYKSIYSKTKLIDSKYFEFLHSGEMCSYSPSNSEIFLDTLKNYYSFSGQCNISKHTK